MKQLILNAIKKQPLTLEDLEARASKRGISLDELYAALEQVHRDKRIKRTVVGDTIKYTYEEPKPKDYTPHLTWLREHYPPMTPENDGSGIEADFSWLFLRTKEDRDAYKAAASGKPLYMVKKRLVWIWYDTQTTSKKMSTPEGKIQLEIIKFLRAERVFCWRNEPLTYNHKLGIYVSSPYVMKGTPDIISIINGQFVGWEVKTPKGSQSADQKLFEKRTIQNGGAYFVVRSVDDARNVLKTLRQ